MKGMSFQNRLLTGVVLLVIATTATLGMVGIHFAGGFLRTRFEERMNFLARYLALNAELGILLGDQAMLERLAVNLVSEKDVVDVWIEDRSGHIMVRTGPGTEELRREAVAPVRLSQEEESLLFMNAPGRDRMLGQVRVFYTAEGIDRLLRHLQALYLIAAMGLGTVGLVVFFFFSRSLIAPLRSLVAAARQAARGDLSTKVEGGAIPEIRQLAEAFNHMLTSLAQSRRALEETYQEMIQQKALAEVGHFAFSVAHEVKNPLGIIRGALDVLKKPEIDMEIRTTMIHYMEDEISRLNRLIQDFLDFSRPRKPVFKRIDLNDLLKTLVERNRLEWEEKGVGLHYSVPEEECLVRVDEDLLSHALLNVIRNACEACEDTGDVWISASFSGGMWKAEISDNGAGMSEEARERALEPFFTTKTQGTGLGLAFVDRVVKAHGGEVVFTGNLNGGTTVSLLLPGGRV